VLVLVITWKEKFSSVSVHCWRAPPSRRSEHTTKRATKPLVSEPNKGNHQQGKHKPTLLLLITPPRQTQTEREKEKEKEKEFHHNAENSNF